MLWKCENKAEYFLALLLIAAGIGLRLLPHPGNFSPVMAIALFSGVTLSAELALTIPLIVMIASDLLIGPHDLFWLTWGAFLVVSVLGLIIRRSPNFKKIFLGTLAGSVFFFVVTNLGVFFFQDMYSKTFSGLVQCYVMALPFFRNALAGDLFYSAALFGSLALAKKLLFRSPLPE